MLLLKERLVALIETVNAKFLGRLKLPIEALCQASKYTCGDFPQFIVLGFSAPIP